MLAFGLLSLTVSLLPGTMLTLRVILCDRYQLAQGKAMPLSHLIQGHQLFVFVKYYTNLNVFIFKLGNSNQFNILE